MKDELFVQLEVFKLLNSKYANWDDLKLILSAIEGVYLSEICKGRLVAFKEEVIILDSKADFTKLHLMLHRLLINKNNARFIKSQKDIEAKRAKCKYRIV